VILVAAIFGITLYIILRAMRYSVSESVT